jgi:uncharacterized protein (TIGR02757 family)
VALSKQRAQALKPLLDAFLASRSWEERIGFDPVEFPRRFADPRDVEVAGLVAASLAYGRADLFKPKVELILSKLGPSPARRLMKWTVEDAEKALKGFVYRFNVGADLAVLLLGIGGVLRERASLEQLFLDGLEASGSWHGGLAFFTEGLRAQAPLRAIRAKLGKERGLAHLLPHPLGKGAAKRLNLYLRWMVRGPDAVDLGVWKRVRAAELLIPVDTHIARISKLLGLTKRNDLSWRTAEEVTAGLRLLDAADPTRYDFALCHYGMSGVCPVVPVKANCEKCLLRSACRVGKRIL